MQVDLTGAIFSFSKLNTYNTCPYSWYDIYINKAERIHNAFSQYGTLIHSVLERYAMGKKGYSQALDTWELMQLLEEEYQEAVTERFPKNAYCDLAEKYYNAAVAFFSEIDEFELIKDIENGKLEILGIEHEFTFDFEVDGEIFKYKGFIDLVVRDTTDNKIIIIDHKSKSIKTNKKGDPVEKDIHDAYLQMSSYATAIKNDFGEYPKEIWIDAFKIQKIFKREFKEEMAEEALEWARNIVRKLKIDTEFEKKPDSFFCTQLCSCRNTCGKYIKFDKTGTVFGDEPLSMAEKINRDSMFFGNEPVVNIVKPFSWDDDEEEFDV